MRKALSVAALALAATSVNAACAGDNALATLFGLTGLVDAGNGDTPVAITAAMSVCDMAVGGTDICCTEAQITTTIQTYLDTLKTTLETAAGVRDQYIIAQRGEVVKVFSSLRRLNELSEDLSTEVALIASAFTTYSEAIATDFSSIVENFETFQTTRATCMSALLKTQAAFACASCLDTEPQGITFATPAVSLDDTLVTQINTACLPYFENSQTQSYIITVSILADGLASLVSALEKYIAEDATGAAEDLAAAFTSFNAASYSTTNAEKAVTLPATCTDTSCATWIEATLFGTDGILSNDAAILGGTAVADPTFTVSRVLEGERRLAANGMVQDLDDITFTTTFDSNPGDVDNTENANSALRNGVAACGIAALAMLF